MLARDLDGRVNAPLIATLLVSSRGILYVFTHEGLGLGMISAVLTTICIVPLFNPYVGGGNAASHRAMPEHDETSQIFAEANPNELDTMRAEEHSFFARLLHQCIEMWSEDIEELINVARVLRENQGLLILLACGVSSMMMALIAGLDNVAVLNALLLSLTCYGITTILVARSARRVAAQNMRQHGEPKLSSSELIKILETVPIETFVPNEGLDDLDVGCIEDMLHLRTKGSQQKSTEIRGDTCASQDLAAEKKQLVATLRQRRNYNDTCCICLVKFGTSDTIRVLPGCHHEFHRTCIDKWANTFVTQSRRHNCNTRRGRPTCPLCNTCLEAAQ